MLPYFTAATVADGTSAAIASEFLSLELQAITPARTGNANAAVRIKEIRFRISATHLFNGFKVGGKQ